MRACRVELTLICDHRKITQIGFTLSLFSSNLQLNILFLINEYNTFNKKEKEQKKANYKGGPAVG